MPAERAGPDIGVLLVNLGSPDAPTPTAVRRYLRQFLSDRRVVELPPLLWQPILRGAILPFRPRRAAANYARIWDTDAGDSPLRVITAAQAEGLADRLGPRIRVGYAMRYGRPSMEKVVADMLDQGCERLLVAPLYPQYCAATTGSVLDELFRLLAGRRVLPALRSLPPYYDHPAYIAALAASVREEVGALGWEPERILLSFHGMPARTRALGDPYFDHCQRTADLLRAAMGHDGTVMPLAFQSRFGRARWLEPYTEPVLVGMAQAGIRRVAVVMPGFAADCIETLEEIAIGARAAFLAAGGTDFAALPCLNAGKTGLDMLQGVIEPQLAGWQAAD